MKITHEEAKVRAERMIHHTQDFWIMYVKQQETSLVKYAKHLAKKFAEYTNWQYNGKNGANSDNEKGYWRGMADSCLAILTDWKSLGLIKHTGLYGDTWPEELEK